ncbi:hypothetical protein MB02_05350 [Croceicoccus estronivorus]|nr:hypothetical protein MB02_05350 [Croceicoccus estronivorus]
MDRQALEAALDDEYKAEATYQSILDRYGAVRPFINIVEAERRHIAMVKFQYARFGMDTPSNPYLGAIVPADSLPAAYQNGVAAELENIALYDRLLPKIVDNGVRATLTRLQSASRDNHLPAFQRCVEHRGIPSGRGMQRDLSQ